MDILTNRIQVLNLPDVISVFHFNFTEEARFKEPLKKYVDLQGEPLAYDGDKILVQYGVTSGSEVQVGHSSDVIESS